MLCPLENQEKGDAPNTTPTKKRKRQDGDSECFHRCAINCAMFTCIQKLGKGHSHLAMIMAFLGLSNGIGSQWKWNRIAEKIGLAEWEAAEEVMEENRKKELELTEAEADDNPLEWSQTEAGADADEEAVNAKRDHLLNKLEGKVGIIVSGDTGWQKRKIGKNGGDSNTGHNCGLGARSELMLSAQSKSKDCRLCDAAARAGKQPKPHRCPKNFDKNKSSKSMEGHCNIQHCADVFESKHNMHACGFVADDDGTTQVNMKHSHAETMKIEHPDKADEDGKICARAKRECGWPASVPADWKDAGNGRHCKPKTNGGCHKKPSLPPLKKDCGLLPPHAPEPTDQCADHVHRKRSLGSRPCKMRAPKAKAKTVTGLDAAECENMKRNFGHFLEKNQHHEDERFETEATCVTHHNWNKHHLCDVEWCANLQARLEPNPAKKRKTDDPRKHRNSEEPGEQKLMDRTINNTKDPLAGPKMKEAHNGCNTQKNEALQKQLTASCPKDVHCGGSMQLHDRIRLPVVLDSLGEHEGLSRLHHNLGLPKLSEPLGVWASTEDKADKHGHECCSRPDVKKRRAAAKVTKMKEEIKKNKRAEKEGVTHGHGIANPLDSSTATSPSASKEL